MDKNAKEKWQKLRSIGKDIAYWNKVKERIKKDDDDTGGNVKTNLIEELNRQIFDLKTQAKSLGTELNPVFRNFMEPSILKKIQKERNAILYLGEIFK